MIKKLARMILGNRELLKAWQIGHDEGLRQGYGLGKIAGLAEANNKGYILGIDGYEMSNKEALKLFKETNMPGVMEQADQIVERMGF